MIILKENEIKLDTYLKLRESVNWKKLDREQARRALDNTLYTVCVYDGEKAIGMGRIVGDGAVVVYVQDLIVIPEYQKMGIGKQLIEHLIEYVKSINPIGNEIMLCLMSAKGRESFYERYGFISRPNDNLGPGMIQYIKE